VAVLAAASTEPTDEAFALANASTINPRVKPGEGGSPAFSRSQPTTAFASGKSRAADK